MKLRASLCNFDPNNRKEELFSIALELKSTKEACKNRCEYRYKINSLINNLPYYVERLIFDKVCIKNDQYKEYLTYIPDIQYNLRSKDESMYYIYNQTVFRLESVDNGVSFK